MPPTPSAPTPSTTRDLRPLLAAGGIGIVVYLAMWLGFSVRFGPEISADDAVLRSLSPHATPGSAWVAVFETISTLCSPTTWRLLAAGVVVLALVRRQFPPPARFAVLGVLLGGFVAEAAKLLADRPRPTEAAVAAFGSSYPSGHAFGVTVAAVGTLFWLWPRLSHRGRMAAAALAASLIALVCFARLALCVHHLSDVVGGVGLGLAWTALSVLIIQRHPWRHHPAANQSAKPGGR